MELAAVLIIIALAIIFYGPALGAALGRRGMRVLRSLRRATQTARRRASMSEE